MITNPELHRWLLVSSLACAWGCSSSRPARIAEVSAEQFTLTLEADWDAVGRGAATEIVHRLSNRSAVAVCVGGFWELRLDGHGVMARTIMDALCATPLTVAEPGEQAEWRTMVELGQCLDESDLGFLPPRRIRCGAEVLLEIEIVLFRWTGTGAEWGGTDVLSRSIPVTRAVDPLAGAATDP